MSDLREMIDGTTERLLKKIDNWEVPQSDKKYVTIEKEVWESAVKRAGKTETLQKQLEIANKALEEIEKNGTNPEIKTITVLCVNNFLLAHKARIEIEELNNAKNR